MSNPEEPNQTTDQEREQLEREVLEELRRERLKTEIVKKLSQPTRKEMVASLIRHPVFLLLLGFLMTAVVGAGLAAYWQNKQWDYQQRRLAQIRDLEQKIKQKNDLKDQIKQDFETVLSADMKLVEPLLSSIRSEKGERTQGGVQSARKALLDELKKWEEAEKQWSASTDQHEQALAFDYKNSEILSAFYELRKSQIEIALAIDDVKETLEPNSPRESERKLMVWTILKGIDETRYRLFAFLQRLVDQIERERSALLR